MITAELNSTKSATPKFQMYDYKKWEGNDVNELNFDVEARPITVGNYTIPDKKALFRVDTDTYLSTVSNNYPIIKHSEIVERLETNFMNKFGDSKVKTILSKDGNIMQRMYEFPEINVEVKKGDIIAPVIRVVNSYNGSTAVGFYIDALRLVCTNGMVATRQFMGMQYRHFGSNFDVNTFADNAKEMIKGFNNYADNWRDWTNYNISEDRARLVLNYLPKKLKCFVESRFDENFDGTKWGLYNILTAVLTHDYTSSKGCDADTQRIKLGAEFTKMMSDKFYWESNRDMIVHDLLKRNRIESVDEVNNFETINI